MKQTESTEKKPMRFRWKVLMHIGLMLVTGLVLAWMSTLFLDFWTHHGEFSVVPDVKGMPYGDAAARLKTDGFEVSIQDSIYDDSLRPGTVVGQNPADSTKVKPGREIFLTIVAFYPQTVMAPLLNDISVRQAKATLEGIGLKNYKVVTIPSDYKDLVLNVVYNGHRLLPGTRLPLDALLVLEVGEGSDLSGEPEVADSLGMDVVVGETSVMEGGSTAEAPAVSSAPASTHAPAPAQEPDSDDDLFD